ncbi:MAG: acyl-CoA thioesterase [Myxococcota bacterium]
MLSLLSHTVRSTEVDFLGHVNNAKYQEYLEWGRFGWMRDAALTRDRFGHAVAPVVVHVSLDYKRETQLDDVLTVETALTKIGEHSLQFRQRVIKEDGAVACDGRVILAMFDMHERAKTKVPTDLRDALKSLVAPRYGEPEAG